MGLPVSTQVQQLEEERRELARFQQVDKQRRSLEYTIYDKEVTETATKLEQVCPELQELLSAC
jgi:structural maintenance of chromosome 3 (chondroitin sulfate proteoglycan 6)